jgi:hypothetical protein
LQAALLFVFMFWFFSTYISYLITFIKYNHPSPIVSEIPFTNKTQHTVAIENVFH